DLAAVAVYAVALAEVALRQRPAPLIPEPRIDLLQVHRPAFEEGVGRVYHAHTRVLDRQAAQILGAVDGIIEGVAGPLGKLAEHPGRVGDIERRADTEPKAGDHQEQPFKHGRLRIEWAAVG